MTSPHPFTTLEPEYNQLIASVQITRLAECQETAKRLLDQLGPYKEAQTKFGIPAIWLATVGEREGGEAIFKSYFGNGDPLNKPTHDVPRNRGPFATFEAGLEDAIAYDHIPFLDGTIWTWPIFCYKGELWNGFGPRNHGKHTGYLWSGTNVYTGGKYVADGVWSPEANDEQLGIVPVARCLIALDASLDIPGWVTIDEPSTPPIGLHDAATLQKCLNAILDSQLAVDGNYGRRTASAVRTYQRLMGLTPDGIAGAETWTSIEAKLKSMGIVQ